VVETQWKKNRPFAERVDTKSAAPRSLTGSGGRGGGETRRRGSNFPPLRVGQWGGSSSLLCWAHSERFVNCSWDGEWGGSGGGGEGRREQWPAKDTRNARPILADLGAGVCAQEDVAAPVRLHDEAGGTESAAGEADGQLHGGLGRGAEGGHTQLGVEERRREERLAALGLNAAARETRGTREVEKRWDVILFWAISPKWAVNVYAGRNTAPGERSA